MTGSIVAVLLSDVGPVGAVPSTVTSTLPPLGRLPIEPLTVLPLTVGCVPHAAPPASPPQAATIALMPAGTTSV